MPVSDQTYSDQSCDLIVDWSPVKKPLQLAQPKCDMITSSVTGGKEWGGVLD